MLLSKLIGFLPGLWPNMFNKAKGCHVWDLDRIYIDNNYGEGTNILGLK